MKRWKKLIALSAVTAFGLLGMSVQTSTVSADSSTSTNEAGGVTYGASKAVKSGEENIWHSVFTPGNSVTDMKDLTFSDPLDTRLEYVSAKVLQVIKIDSQGDPATYGKNITDQGTLSFEKATNTVSWTPKTPKEFMYAPGNANSRLDLIIKTKVKAGTPDGTIPNTAVMTLGGKTYKTNDPSLTVKTPVGTKLKKTIGKLGKATGKLAKTGVKLAQAHPIMAILLGILMSGGFGTWGYRVWHNRH